MVIVSFDSKEAMENVSRDEFDPLSSIFMKIRLWSMSEWSFPRCVWIECHDLSPHTWSISNLHKIEEVWGIVVGFDDSIVNRRSFSVARILMDTNIRSFIK